jgi:hypothetical protein
MNRKVIGAAFLGFVALKAASRHHAMVGGFGPREPGMVGGFGPSRRGFGPRGRHGFGPGGADQRRQWIREFHRSLHEADEAKAAGTTSDTDGDAPSTTNPATAG